MRKFLTIALIHDLERPPELCSILNAAETDVREMAHLQNRAMLQGKRRQDTNDVQDTSNVVLERSGFLQGGI